MTDFGGNGKLTRFLRFLIYLRNANLYGKNRLLQEKGTPADDLLRRAK
jgi:hypothetical protein